MSHRSGWSDEDRKGWVKQMKRRLRKGDVDGVLKDFPQFAASLRAIARSRS